jgi:hypothetical protein
MVGGGYDQGYAEIAKRISDEVHLMKKIAPEMDAIMETLSI